MISRMKNHHLVKFSLPLIISVLIGCKDEPTSIGIGLLSPNDIVRLDTVTTVATDGVTIRKRINTGGSQNILVGRYQGYEARTLLLFSPIPDTLKDATVLSATLVLRQSYRFGNAQGNLSFTVNEVRQGWTQYGVTWDSVTTGFFDAAARGSFDGAVADSDSVVVSVDPSLVKSWFTASGTSPILGMMLLPTPSSTMVVGFHSFQSLESSSWPLLTVTYAKGTVQDTISFAAGADTFVANVENLPPDPSLMFVQAGVAYRPIVRFEFPTVPEHSGIHQATLELTLNRTASQLNSFTVDSLFAFLAVNADSVDSRFPILGRRLDQTSDVYTFTITPFVQRWINGGPNVGLQLEAWAEAWTLDLFTFYSPSASPTLRPKLRVFFSRFL
jgi:hypothetical protein